MNRKQWFALGITSIVWSMFIMKLYMDLAVPWDLIINDFQMLAQTIRSSIFQALSGGFLGVGIIAFVMGALEKKK